jgi:hypothetical protein
VPPGMGSKLHVELFFSIEHQRRWSAVEESVGKLQVVSERASTALDLSSADAHARARLAPVVHQS